MFIIRALIGKFIATALISAMTMLYGWLWPSTPHPDQEVKIKFAAIVERTRHEIAQEEAAQATDEHRRTQLGLRHTHQL